MEKVKIINGPAGSGKTKDIVDNIQSGDLLLTKTTKTRTAIVEILNRTRGKIGVTALSL